MRGCCVLMRLRTMFICGDSMFFSFAVSTMFMMMSSLSMMVCAAVSWRSYDDGL